MKFERCLGFTTSGYLKDRIKGDLSTASAHSDTGLYVVGKTRITMTFLTIAVEITSIIAKRAYTAVRSIVTAPTPRNPRQLTSAPAWKGKTIF